MKKFFLFSLAVFLTGIGIAACATGRAGYKSAPYQTTQQEGPFEVREYPALQLATTGMSGEDKSFRRLFNYISGQNETKQKIAMTTPVRRFAALLVIALALTGADPGFPTAGSHELEVS